MKKFKRPDGRGPQGRKSSPGRGPHGRSAPQGRPRGAPEHGPQGPRLFTGRPVVGIHAVTELLKVRPRAVTAFLIRDKYEDHPGLTELAGEAEELNIRVQTHPPGYLDKITSNHQGVIAYCDAEPEIEWKDLAAAETCTLIALDEVEDPHNLGAVLRTAWLLGAMAVLTPEHRSAQLSPAVSKVAQGAVEHVPVVRDGPLPQQLEELKKHGFWVLGLSHKAKQGLFELEIPKKVIWVLGSESSGLRKSVEGACDDLVSIPQGNPGASYNVSVAAAIALSETHRQRTLHI